MTLAAIWAFLGSSVGRYAMIGLGAIALLTYVDQRGASRERAKCRAAAIQAQLDAKNVDLNAAREAASDAERETARINTELDSERRKVADYAAKLKARPECLLDDNDVGTGGVRKRTRRPTS